MSNVFKYAMPSGIPGMPSRVGGLNPMDNEAQFMDPANPLPVYGLFGQIDATTQKFRILEAGDATVYGLLVRPFPFQATTASLYSGASPLGTAAVPPTTGPVGVMKLGYMTVALQNATPAVKNGIVYARVNGVTADLIIGGIEAADDGGNTIATNAYFTGPADESGNVEIAFNIN